MISHAEIQHLREIARIQTDNAKKYSVARKEAGEAEANLKILLASKINKMREDKKNLGIDMAILILCSECEESKNLYKEWITKEAIYKGLEKLIDATASKLIFEQSLMKFQHTGERFG